MSYDPERTSLEVFNAAAAPLRLRILKLLNVNGPLNYTEIMNKLKLSPSRDAGKFAYHLKGIVKSGLINLDKETKKYHLSFLGRMVIEFSQKIEEQTQRLDSSLIVRTSQITMEQFDRDKIVQMNKAIGFFHTRMICQLRANRSN